MEVGIQHKPQKLSRRNTDTEMSAYHYLGDTEFLLGNCIRNVASAPEAGRLNILAMEFYVPNKEFTNSQLVCTTSLICSCNMCHNRSL